MNKSLKEHWKIAPFRVKSIDLLLRFSERLVHIEHATCIKMEMCKCVVVSLLLFFFSRVQLFMSV